MTGNAAPSLAAGGPLSHGRPGRVPLDSLPQHLGADAERLLIGASVYREPADRNALLFQVGQHDWAAARAPDRQGPAPPYQAPAGLQEMLAACEAAGLLVVAPGSADGRTVFVEPWMASDLHRLLTAAGRGAELNHAHQCAAAYWQWRSAAWPQGRRADIHDLLEARHHLFDSGDTEQASTITESVCTQLHAWGDLGRESALIHETLDRLPARSSRRAAWIYELGSIAGVKGDHAEAELRYLRALDMFASVGDRAGVSRSYHGLGVLAQAQGEYEQAERRYQQASDAAERPAGSGVEEDEPPDFPAHDIPPARDLSPAGEVLAGAALLIAAEPAAAAASAPGNLIPARAEPPAADRARADPARAEPPAADPPAAWRPTTADLLAAAWRPAADEPAPAAATVPVMPASAALAMAFSPAPVMAFSPPATSGPVSAGPREPAGRHQPAGIARRPRMTPVILPEAAPRSGSAPVPVPAGSSHRRRQRRWASGWRLPCLAAIALALAAFSAAEISGSFSAAPGARPLPKAPAREASPAGPARQAAAVWVDHQVARSAIIACDPAMCSAIQAQGVPAGNLIALGPAGAADPLGSNVVVATAAVRSLFGARLAAVYAPVVIARFGTGSASIEVRVVAADGSAAYLTALKSDRVARREAGAQLLLNKRISVAAAARRQLIDGLVDSRLLATLAALAHMHSLRIVSFGSSGPGASASVPLPSVVVTGAGDGSSAAYLAAMLTFLRAQRPPYLAAGERLGRLSPGQETLRIEFAEPSPLELLPAGGTPLSVPAHR